MANRDLTLFASAARTADPKPEAQVNFDGQGVHVTIDVTAVGVTPSVVFNVEGFDPGSGKWYLILASAAIAAIAAVGTTVLKVFRGATAAANLAANDQVPPQWRVRPVHGNAVSITYSVGASVIT